MDDNVLIVVHIPSRGEDVAGMVDYKCPHCAKPMHLADRVVGRSVTCPGCKAAVFVAPEGSDPPIGRRGNISGRSRDEQRSDTPADRRITRRRSPSWRPFRRRSRSRRALAESLRGMAWFSVVTGAILAGIAAAASPVASLHTRMAVGLIVLLGGFVYGAILRNFASQFEAIAAEKEPADRDEAGQLTPDERELLRRYRNEPDGDSEYWPPGKGVSLPLTDDEIAALRKLLRWSLADSPPTDTPPIDSPPADTPDTPGTPQDDTTDA